LTKSNINRAGFSGAFNSSNVNIGSSNKLNRAGLTCSGYAINRNNCSSNDFFFAKDCYTFNPSDQNNRLSDDCDITGLTGGFNARDVNCLRNDSDDRDIANLTGGLNSGNRNDCFALYYCGANLTGSS
jgi:hypothetical protein